MTWSKTQSVSCNSPKKATTESPLIRSKSLRSSIKLKISKKSRKSSSDIVNANKQEMQEIFPKDKKQVVEKEKIETEEILSDKKQPRQKGSGCKNCCVIS